MGPYSEWPFEFAGGNTRTWDLTYVFTATSLLDTSSKKYVISQQFIFPDWEDSHLTIRNDSTYNMADSLAKFLEVQKSGKVIYNSANGQGLRSFKIGELELLVDYIRIQQGPLDSYWTIGISSTQLFDNDKRKREIKIYGKYLIR